LGLSLFDTGLMITIVTLLVLYLVVLIKLKPSSKAKETLETSLSKKKILESPPTEGRNNSQIFSDLQEEPVEKVELSEGAEETESFERPEPAPSRATTEFSKGTRNSECPHHFGYLREHPKNTPIPNECLTCTKIMECLLRSE